METLWMTRDGFTVLAGFIVGVVVLAIVSAEVEMAWDRWKNRKRKDG